MPNPTTTHGIIRESPELAATLKKSLLGRIFVRAGTPRRPGTERVRTVKEITRTIFQGIEQINPQNSISGLSLEWGESVVADYLGERKEIPHKRRYTLVLQRITENQEPIKYRVTLEDNYATREERNWGDH